MVSETTPVAIIGGGVAGLTAAVLLHARGIPSIVLERQSREYVEKRQRAGVVETRAVRMFDRWGLSDRLFGKGHTYPGLLEMRVEGESRFLDEDFDGGPMALICPQQVLVQRLIAAFLEDGGDLRFCAADVTPAGLGTDSPVVCYTSPAGERHEISCAYVAGCDGDHGISRSSVAGALTAYSFDHGLSWLTVLATAPPPQHPLMAISRHGFAAQFGRGPRASRFYLECGPGETTADWPDSRIHEQLRARLGRPDLDTGTVTETEMFALRSVVHEPMHHGRLFLLGDAAHVISPLGGKGMNLAVYDAEVFARGVAAALHDGDPAPLRAYSQVCTSRVWNYQEYSRWLLEMTHDAGDLSRPFQRRLALARLDRLTSSAAARRAYAELASGLC